ncbi:MAG: hypothetical protein V4587_04855 [Acidobacteriota bacterium]
MIALMLIACAIGLACALAVFLLVRKRSWKKPTMVAGLFPPSMMAYLLACVVVSGILSSFIGTPDLLFGDINESLPNGYRLHALDKMPEAGSIQKDSNSLASVAWVGDLQIVGSKILGKYDYTYFSKAKGEVDRNFFLFDTQTGKVQNFATETQLTSAMGIVPHLTPTPYFHGSKTALQVISTYALLFVAFVPPAAIALWLLWRLRECLKGEPDDPDHA